MKKPILFFIFLSLLTACHQKVKEERSTEITEQIKANSDSIKPEIQNSTAEQSENISEFVPKGYVLFKERGLNKIRGDLNKDGLEDIVLIIKKVDKNNIIQDETRGALDRNRRGIIILFNKGNHYELADKNYNCFSSENENGGNYFPPDLGAYVEKGNLNVHYAYGRYGYWRYVFRYQDGVFKMIGYDASDNRGPVPQYKTSINFLTKKKLTRDNLNKNIEQDTSIENFKDTWENIPVKNLIKLSEINDFDELDFASL